MGGRIMEKQLFEQDYQKAAEQLSKMLKRRMKYYEESFARINPNDPGAEKALKSLQSVRGDTDTILSYLEATEALNGYLESQLALNEAALARLGAIRKQEVAEIEQATKLAVKNYAAYQKIIHTLTVKLAKHEPVSRS
jgi:hypothetical protein